MAATTTTLDGAVSAQATTVKLTAYTNPSHPYGTPIMLLVGGTEQMRMLSVAGRVLSVMRGQAGTSALAHVTGATVSYGASQDISGLGSDVGVTQPAALVDSASVTWDTSVPGQVTAAAAGGGAPGGSDTQVQFNNSGAFGGSANLTWDGTNVGFTASHGLSFAGTLAPITIQGGDDSAGDTAIVFSNPTDDYVVLRTLQDSDIVSDGGIGLWSNYPNYPAGGRIFIQNPNTGNNVFINAGDGGGFNGGRIEITASTGSAHGTVIVTGTMVAPVIVLPTADPHVVGGLWNNAGTITISAG